MRQRPCAAYGNFTGGKRKARYDIRYRKCLKGGIFTGVYFKLGNIDLSGFITENKFSVSRKPRFDEESSFININGEQVRKRLGTEYVLSAELSDVDNNTALAIAEILSSGKAYAEFSSPAQIEMEMTDLGNKLSLDRVYKGNKFWTVQLSLYGFVRDCL